MESSEQPRRGGFSQVEFRLSAEGSNGIAGTGLPKSRNGMKWRYR